MSDTERAERAEQRRERRASRRQERVKRESRVVDAPLAPPSANSGLLEVFRRRYLLSLLVRREISARYQGSFLGLFWSYIQPATRLAMYYFVISVILDKGIENFAIHLFAGLVIVHYFTETFGAGTHSIVRNKALVRKMAVPREMFPVASMLTSAYHVIPGMVLLVAFCVGLGWTPDPVGVAAVLLGFTLVAIWGTGLALLFSAANVFFRDFSNVVQTLTQFTTFSVPMIYPYSMVSDRFGEYAQFYLFNPMAEAVLLFQRGFWAGTTKDVEATLADHFPDDLFLIGFAHVGVALVFLVIAQLAFTRLENKIPERL
ncbi:ABC transporter [Nocardioides sp. dk4132]|uniref:ABC transporter permease n=1 Tax=unclassified Nocardioides TaxID=2615069 RepID=UPI001295C022|nr:MULTISPECIES: ABC transporter permease [unclassified Nocardioides]MQW75700.1 ABC transporter [Nocardioides sp. dk4132]QGA08590.1 ABC transporter [Nocardioides sp. dk884]